MEQKLGEKEKNKLIYGDSLNVMRKYIRSGTIDAIITDPPWNEKKMFNITVKESNGENSMAQMRAYDDTWSWSGYAEKKYDEIMNMQSYSKLKDLLTALISIYGKCGFTAYMIWISINFVECKRVLKDTGSIYVHCDPKISSQIYLIMEQVFGRNNFRNSISWCYKGASEAKMCFPRKHDIILFFSKSPKAPFYCDSIRVPYKKGVKESNPLGTKCLDWFSDIPSFMNASRSREYCLVKSRTKKPLKLVKRLIQSVTNVGDLVLDPFVGSGTTVLASEILGRKWIGIDVSYFQIRKTMDRIRLESSDIINVEGNKIYEVFGEPESIEAAKHLAKKNRHKFGDWCILKIGGTPNIKKSGDGGVDGDYRFIDDKEYKKVKIQATSLQSGLATKLRDLCGIVDGENVVGGIFITLKEPSKQMITEASSHGFYVDKFGTHYPKIQIISVKDILNHKKPNFPTCVHIEDKLVETWF